MLGRTKTYPIICHSGLIQLFNLCIERVHAVKNAKETTNIAKESDDLNAVNLMVAMVTPSL